ncbi:GyrI-like domain-containing protein [Clostridium polynesiense]|uniref:GyrI-like domain-containing protein n=1 Tax=Clostridium polynesiense TaxID=1325933 RepID=UPI00059100C8|nr:GyrI-like domain-containing protein [Clostridium polynesiense]
MEIVEKKGFKVVGIKVEGDWQTLSQEMDKTWQWFFNKANEIKHKVGNSYMDICLQEDSGVYTQLICAEVERFEDIPHDMTYMEIGSDRYLYSVHKGDLTEIPGAFEEIYNWADARGYNTDEFKIDYGYEENGLEVKHDLYVRILD